MLNDLLFIFPTVIKILNNKIIKIKDLKEYYKPKGALEHGESQISGSGSSYRENTAPERSSSSPGPWLNLLKTNHNLCLQ